MKAFFHHVGAKGSWDFGLTVAKSRTREEMLRALPRGDERDYFESDRGFRAAFPDGSFNCWGVPRGASTVIENLRVGDLVLLVHSVGRYGQGIRFMGLVKAICPVEAPWASDVLWNAMPEKSFPLIFFFDSEEGSRVWTDFCDDMGWKATWNPTGHFLRIQEPRMSRWGGAEGYLDFLRDRGGFRPVPS